ncbi:hypothetical protein TIFTF001_048250, partial [Ficus carica]
HQKFQTLLRGSAGLKPTKILKRGQA